MTMRSTPGLMPTVEVLSNGTTVLTKQSCAIPAVTMSVTLQVGFVHDPESLPGLSFFLSRVVDRGTTHQSADTIAEVFDVRGVSLRVNLTRHLLTFSCDCLTEDFDVILALLADIVRYATCLDPEIITRRGEILIAIQQDDENTGVTAMQHLMLLLYGASHPYSRRAKGTLESVGRVDQNALLRHYKDYFVPSGLSVVVVGDIAAAAAVDAVSRVFGDWQSTSMPGSVPESPRLPATRQRVVVPIMNKSQADIAYGFTTIARSDQAYYAYRLMTNILGQYGMGGRLGASIRERQGMAYYAFCGFEADIISCPLIVRAGVNADNVDQAVVSIDKEISKLAADGVTDDELADSKQYLVGSLPRNLETNAGIAAFLQNAHQFQLGLDYDKRLPGLLERVTKDEVNAAASCTLVPHRAALAIAGPYQDEKPVV